MPNAAVRANARTLPETTDRHAVLGADLAAGSAGAPAILPAAAATQNELTKSDRQILAQVADAAEKEREILALRSKFQQLMATIGPIERR
jgi:hypothetical protein